MRGRSNPCTASTFPGIGLIPFSDTWWPKNSISRTPNSHLALFSTNPNRLRAAKSCVKSRSCCSGVGEATKTSSMYHAAELWCCPWVSGMFERNFLVRMASEWIQTSQTGLRLLFFVRPQARPEPDGTPSLNLLLRRSCNPRSQQQNHEYGEWDGHPPWCVHWGACNHRKAETFRPSLGPCGALSSKGSSTACKCPQHTSTQSTFWPPWASRASIASALSGPADPTWEWSIQHRALTNWMLTPRSWSLGSSPTNVRTTRFVRRSPLK